MTQSQPIVRQMLLTLVVAVGIAAAWCSVTFWVVTTLVQTIGRHQPAEGVYVRYDGEPVLMRYEGGGSVANRRLVTLDGEPARGNPQQVSYPSYLAAPRLSPSNGGNNRLAGANDGGVPATYWYLIHDGRANGQAYGVGYDAVSKQVTGYFSRSGFSEQRPPREDWFQIAGDQGLDLATPDITNAEPYGREPFIRLLADGQLWLIDMRKKKVQSLLPCPTAFNLGWSWRMIAELPPEEDDPHVFVVPQRKLVARSLDSLTIIDQRSGEQTVLPLPRSMQDQQCACFERADGSFILMTMEVRDAHWFHRVVWLDKAGIVQRERTLELGSTQAFDNPAVGAILAATAVPMPLLIELLPFFIATEPVSSEFDSYSAALLAALADFWPAMLLVAAIGLALALSAYRRQRHYALPYAGLWAVFVFVLGVPGYVAYRFHRTWPALEDCPRCGEQSPRDRDRCSDCGATFPPPELKGLEIFA